MVRMVHREKRHREIERVNVQKVVLQSLAVAGIVSVAVFAPNALQMLGMFNSKNRNYRSSYYIRTVITQLEKNKLAEIKKTKWGPRMRITEKGKLTLRAYEKISKKRKETWDGRWRIVIFDIKEYKRSVRDALRFQLVAFGFVKLQNSVWVYPYACEEIIALLKIDVRVGKDVLYLVVEKLENDDFLRKHFGLPAGKKRL
jgi:predicted transcriptional regulator/CRISPR/Cas system-associated endoribonuclease Cas2